MNDIANRNEILEKFTQTIKLNLVHFGPKKFGFVCAQTQKRMFIEYPTRLDAAVGIVSRYFTAQAGKDGAYINPHSVASTMGSEMALDLLVSTGFVRIENDKKQKKAVIFQNFDMEKNQ